MLPVAVKIMSRSRAPSEFRERFMPREIQIAQQLHHQNIVETYEVIELDDKVYMVMEMAPNGDLLRYVRAQKRFDEDVARRYLLQICSALDYLHQMSVAHRVSRRMCYFFIFIFIYILYI